MRSLVSTSAAAAAASALVSDDDSVSRFSDEISELLTSAAESYEN